MFDQTQIKLWIEAAGKAWDACGRQTCFMRLSKRTNIAHQTREQKNVFKLFNRMFHGLQILSNTIKQSVQTVYCLVTKQ